MRKPDCIPLVSVVTMLLLLLEMATLFGGADEAYDLDDIVLAVSAAIDNDLMEDVVGDMTDCDAVEGDWSGPVG